MDGSRLVLHKVCLFEFRRSFVLKRIWMCDRCFVVAFGGKPMCHHYSFQGHRVVNKLVMLGTRTYHKTCDELRTYNWQLVAICEFMNLWKIGSHPLLPASDLTNGIAPTHTHTHTSAATVLFLFAGTQCVIFWQSVLSNRVCIKAGTRQANTMKFQV